MLPNIWSLCLCSNSDSPKAKTIVLLNSSSNSLVYLPFTAASSIDALRERLLAYSYCIILQNQFSHLLSKSLLKFISSFSGSLNFLNRLMQRLIQTSRQEVSVVLFMKIIFINSLRSEGLKSKLFRIFSWTLSKLSFEILFKSVLSLPTCDWNYCSFSFETPSFLIMTRLFLWGRMRSAIFDGLCLNCSRSDIMNSIEQVFFFSSIMSNSYCFLFSFSMSIVAEYGF